MRYLTIIFCALLLLVLAQQASSGVIHVPGDYPSIRQALSHAQSGDTVLVAPGTYDEVWSVVLDKTGVVLLSESGPEVTIIDMQCRDWEVIEVQNGASDTTAVISGFTITGGCPTGAYGGGIWCKGSPIIENCIITDNHALHGGGIYASGQPVIRNNIISYNTASDRGGGILIANTQTIVGNVIHHNSANYGGGLYNLSQAVKCSSNTIVSNYSPQGSALWNENSIYWENNIIAYQAGGVAVYDNNDCIYGSCNDYWSNSGGDVGRGVSPPCEDPTGINGNIKEDPMFCDAGNDDYHLHVYSPCVDAPDCGQIGALYVGCDTVVFFDFEDQNGPVSNVEVIGIYGNGVDADENGIDDGTEEVSGSTNAEGKIALAIPVGRDVTIMASTEEHRMEIASFLDVEKDQSESILLTILGLDDYFRKEVPIVTPMLTDMQNFNDFSFYVAHLDQHVPILPNDNLIYKMGSKGWETMSSENTDYAILTSNQFLESETVLARLTRIGGINDMIHHMTYERMIGYCNSARIEDIFGGPDKQCFEFLYGGGDWITAYYQGKYYRRRENTKAIGMWFECLNCTEEYIPEKMELEVSSAGEFLAIDAAGRMTGSYYEDGIFNEDKFDIPGVYYSGHGSHPNIIFVKDTVTLSQVVLQPLATGTYQLSIRSQNGPTFNSYQLPGEFADLSPQVIDTSLFPDSSKAPVAIINFDTLTVDSAAFVYLDGTASYDPGGDQIFFNWMQNGQTFSQSPTLSKQFPSGLNLIILEVTDEHNYCSYDYALLHVCGEEQQRGSALLMVQDSISGRFITEAKTVFEGPQPDTAFTDQSGKVAARLPPGTYDLTISKDNYQNHYELAVEIDTNDLYQLTANLIPNLGKVSGRALTESTLVGLEGAVIEYIGSDTGLVMSSVDGVYQIIDLLPGVYQLTATRQGIASQDTANINVQTGIHVENVDFTFPSFLRGDANGDGEINLADAVYLVNYLFIGGPPPDPLEAGDANCDGGVDLADAVYIINYLFIGGPPPGC